MPRPPTVVGRPARYAVRSDAWGVGRAASLMSACRRLTTPSERLVLFALSFGSRRATSEMERTQEAVPKPPEQAGRSRDAHGKWPACRVLPVLLQAWSGEPCPSHFTPHDRPIGNGDA